MKIRKWLSNSGDTSSNALFVSLNNALNECHPIFVQNFIPKKYVRTNAKHLLNVEHSNGFFGSSFLNFWSGNLKTCHFCMLVIFGDVFPEISNEIFNKTTSCMIRPHTRFCSKPFQKNSSFLNQDFHSYP